MASVTRGGAVHAQLSRILRTPRPSCPRVGTALAVSIFMGNLFWLIIVILVLMWLGGFAFHVGGGLIHLLLVIALIVVVVRLLTGRRVV